ncbi:MAG: DUF4340 domain-containing protein [Clostridia bacterium]|nr:DUF4340 domain-containing protein [Clostridia bacterium]
MIKRQKIAIIAAVVALVAVAVLYFALVKPMIDENSAVVEDPPETLPGEDIGTSNRYYMYSHLDRSEMRSIEVTNEYGTYKFIADGEGSFYIDGYRGIEVDGTLLSSLVTTCGSTLSKLRVTADASDEKLEEYGLKNPTAYWILTDNSGKQYKVYVGRKLLTGGGYYCAFAGRNSVYVLDTTLASTILEPIETFVTPYIIYGVSQDDFYTVEDFTIYNGNQRFITVGMVDKNEWSSEDALAEYVLSYPAPYTPDSEKYLSLLLAFSSFTADSTFKLGVEEKDLETYGFTNPDHTVYFRYNGSEYYFLMSDDGEGGYYVLSGIYPDIITRISKENAAFADYDLLSWLSPYFFRRNITTISSIRVQTGKVDETFNLSHFTSEDGTASFQILTDSGRAFTSAFDIKNFRHYYGNLLALGIVDYLPEEASEGVSMESFLADEANRTMRITCVTLNGYKYTFDIYRYSTRRCAVSVNGRFDFCILNDIVSRIESDTEKFLNGEQVTGTY